MASLPDPNVDHHYAFVVYDAQGEWQYDTRCALDWVRFPANIAVVSGGRGKGRTTLLRHIAMRVWVPTMVASRVPFEILIVTSTRGLLEQQIQHSAASCVRILDADSDAARASAFQILNDEYAATATATTTQRLVIVDVMGIFSAGEEATLSRIANLPPAAATHTTLLVGSMLSLPQETLGREMHLVCERREPLTMPLILNHQSAEVEDSHIGLETVFAFRVQCTERMEELSLATTIPPGGKSGGEGTVFQRWVRRCNDWWEEWRQRKQEEQPCSAATSTRSGAASRWELVHWNKYNGTDYDGEDGGGNNNAEDNEGYDASWWWWRWWVWAAAA